MFYHCVENWCSLHMKVGIRADQTLFSRGLKRYIYIKQRKHILPINVALQQASTSLHIYLLLSGAELAGRCTRAASCTQSVAADIVGNCWLQSVWLSCLLVLRPFSHSRKLCRSMLGPSMTQAAERMMKMSNHYRQLPPLLMLAKWKMIAFTVDPTLYPIFVVCERWIRNYSTGQFYLREENINIQKKTFFFLHFCLLKVYFCKRLPTHCCWI